MLLFDCFSSQSSPLTNLRQTHYPIVSDEAKGFFFMIIILFVNDLPINKWQREEFARFPLLPVSLFTPAETLELFFLKMRRLIGSS